MDTAARDAGREITERMEAIERDIARIRVTRESEVEDRRKLRREVVTYYEGYVNDVNRHKTKLERKISMHHENTGNTLLKEEIHLGKENYELVEFPLPIFNSFRTMSNGSKISLRTDRKAS